MPGRLLEWLGHDGRGDDPLFLQLDGVAHTARRTGASPADGSDHQVTLFRQLSDQLGRGIPRKGALPAPEDRGILKAFGEHLFDHRQDLIGPFFAVVQKPDPFATELQDAAQTLPPPTRWANPIRAFSNAIITLPGSRSIRPGTTVLRARLPQRADGPRQASHVPS